MSLKEYVRKRNFRKTAEPRGGRVATAARGARRFVVQKHAASRLHYDFRLEIGGTLKSWAVPKGIPFEKGERRLAVHVEDHPVSYIDFEGTIPQGQYGGGTVMVWDRGIFETQSAAPAKDLAGGKLHFTLKGKKLRGDWYLVRLRGGDQWLLIRGGEDMKPVSDRADDTSAASGKSMTQIAAAKRGRVWKSNRKEKTAEETKSGPRRPRRAAKAGDGGDAMATKEGGPGDQFIEPMKALLLNDPPAGEWIYEIKFDGFRALAFIEGGDARLVSRNNKDFSSKFPEVARAFAQLDARDAILDGEIVALDEQGRSSFQLLQAFELGEERPPIYFYGFDLLSQAGRSLMSEPLAERKARLEKLLKNAPDPIRYSASLSNDPEKLLTQARRLGLEGLIGKKPDSRYEPGRRSGAWIKLKLHQEQEFVIGGYTQPGGSRLHFGALLVGYHETGKLKFAGKVGTGFDAALLKSLHAKFQTIATATCPFADLPEARSGRYGQGVTAAEMKRCHWVKPTLVCQIKFSEWTRDGRLRQPVFLGLREDKMAREVVREKGV